MANANESPLAHFDFALLSDPSFKEDAVREEIVHPLLTALGYSSSGPNYIVRSKRLDHPFLTVGSNERALTLVPDYLLTVGRSFRFVLDAKGPGEEIKTGKNVHQVYSYAIHPEIRVQLFALCNGKEFILFDIHQKEPLLHFLVEELHAYWGSLADYLLPTNTRADLPTRRRGTVLEPETSSYLEIVPPVEITTFYKQATRRHFGVHGYFTRQVWSVVQHYIKTFSRPGDVVLDPFGGTGVTLVEALMLGRRAVHVDINPLSTFIVKNLIEPVDMADLGDSFRRIKADFQELRPKSEEAERAVLQRFAYPSGFKLPKTSDVNTVEELFSQKQLAELALLKSLIMREAHGPIRQNLLLMFSGLLKPDLSQFLDED